MEDAALHFALALHLAEPRSDDLRWFHRHRAEEDREAVLALAESPPTSEGDRRPSRRFLARLRQVLADREADRERARAHTLDIELCHWNEVGPYPESLRDLEGPPAVLYRRGTGAWPPERPYTLVGSRRASPTGLRFARQVAAELGRRGATIVSGLALGVDQAAHRGGLDGNAPGLAVLAAGLDRPLPPLARLLAEQLCTNGHLLSEMPLGTVPHPAHFPRRNRILAALSPATLVFEADHRSGSLITVHRALDLGREIWTVPGDVGRPTCRGTNELLRDGARPLVDLRDLDALLPPVPGASSARTEDPLLGALHEPRSVSDLALALAIGREELCLRLVDLELAGRVRSIGGGVYVRCR